MLQIIKSVRYEKHLPIYLPHNTWQLIYISSFQTVYFTK